MARIYSCPFCSEFLSFVALGEEPEDMDRWISWGAVLFGTQQIDGGIIDTSILVTYKHREFTDLMIPPRSTWELQSCGLSRTE